MTTISLNIHARNETVFETEKISDFVSLRIGPDANLFLSTPKQALALYTAAGEALTILHAMQIQMVAEKEGAKIEAEKEAKLIAEKIGARRQYFQEN